MTAATTIDVLECSVVRAVIGIPRGAVEQVIEYELSPLPAAARYVGGLGVHDGALLVSVALTPALGNSRRFTRGVVVSSPSSSVRWVVEVTRVASFIGVEPTVAEVDPRATSAMPIWIQRARAGARTLLAIDIGLMIGELTRGGAA